MEPTSEAENHLRVIRSLMERATFYRSVSSQAALLGGLLACLAGGLLAGSHDPFVGMGPAAHSPTAALFGFQFKWLVVLILSGAANYYFLYRHAQSRGETFVSPGMRTAIRAMTPPLLCGAVFTSLCGTDALPQLWMLFYGLALLATAHFAPTSLVRLGWSFLFAGLLLLLVNGQLMLGLSEHSAIPLPSPPPVKPWTYPDALMAFTFGGFHLIYAACTARRAAPAEPLPVI